MVAGVTPQVVGAFLCWDVGIFECGENRSEPTSFNLTNNDTNIIGPAFFCLESRDDVFIGRGRVGWVRIPFFFATGTFRRFIIIFSDHRHDPRSGVVFHSFVVLVSLLLVSGHVQRSVTQFECEDGAARRHLAGDCGRASQLERSGGVGHKGAVLFLTLLGQLLSTYFRVRHV